MTMASGMCNLQCNPLHSLAVFWLKTSACKCYTVYLFAEEPDCMFRQFLDSPERQQGKHSYAGLRRDAKL